MANLDQLIADLTSGDDARAEAAVPALTVHGDRALAALLDASDSPIADRRWWIVRALAEFPHEAAGEALIDALSDPDDAVRHCASLGLKQNPRPEAVPVLVDLLGASDRMLSRLAADALAALGAEAVPALDRAARDDDPAVRIEAVRALANMRHPDAIGPLFKSIDDPSSVVTHWAEEGLDRLGIGMEFFSP